MLPRRAVLFLALALAGCLSQPSNAVEGEKVLGAFGFAAPVRIDGVPARDELGAYLEEGCVAVSPDGNTVLAAFHGRFDEFSPVYRSLDRGATWLRITLPPAGVSGDCALAMLDDGSWVVLGSTVVGATVLVSRDQGATWTANAVSAVPTSGGWADRPWLLGFGNEIWLAYMPSYNSVGTVSFTKSRDHGASWSPPVLIGESADGSSTKLGAFARSGNEVYLPIARSLPLVGALGSPAAIEIATTIDGGGSWSIETAFGGAETDWPSLAVTPSGHHVLAITLSAGQGTQIAVLVREGAGPWSEPVLLHGANDTFSDWPFLDAGQGANVTWLVSESSVGGAEELWAGQFDARTLRTSAWAIGTGAFEFASVDHSADGSAFIAWSDWKDRLFVRGELGAVAAMAT